MKRNTSYAIATGGAILVVAAILFAMISIFLSDGVEENFLDE